MRSTPPSRGITLIELCIAMVVSAIVLLGAIMASNAQQRSFYDSQRARNAMENARSALLYLEQQLPLAGLGLDPSLAIDFQFYTTANNAIPCPGEMNPCDRDKTGDADELVFYARNPNYWIPNTEPYDGPYQGRLWRPAPIPTPITGSNITLTVRKSDFFPMGQILQLVCAATLNYAYFTVSANTLIAADGDVPVPLLLTNTSNPFRRQDVAVGFMNGCQYPRVFQIDRYRLHIRPVAQGGGRFIPYLMLDRGIDWTGSSSGGPDGVIDDKDEIIVAEGIEAFQVAYLLADPALGRAGATAGTPIVFSAANADQTISITPGPNLIARTNFPGTALLEPGWSIYTPSSYYRYNFDSPMRKTIHQANIRAVQIALVARSPEPDPTTSSNILVNSSFTLLNQSGAPIWITNAPAIASGTDGYQRAIVNTVIDLPNMTLRSLPTF